jgi:hypothetical protein
MELNSLLLSCIVLDKLLCGGERGGRGGIIIHKIFLAVGL